MSSAQDKKRKRSLGSVKRQLLLRSREAALSAISVFNDPLTIFKSETFIVLVIIAWTYLLHAYYRSKQIDYRYYDKKGARKQYIRNSDGAIRHWELRRCLEHQTCPIDNETRKNLFFLIGLRDEIEHRMAPALDNYSSGRYQACVINYNDYIKRLFGEKYGIDSLLTYSIQLMGITEEQIAKPKDVELPPNLLAYIAKFDSNLTDQELNSPRFSYGLLFTRKLVNRPGQADKVVEFVPASSEIAKLLNKETVYVKGVEPPKYRPKDVVLEVQKAGFSRFRVNPEHLQMWRAEDAKNPAKGYGTPVAGAWFWYDRWIKRCIELCQAAGEKYK
ncbi:MAG: DUF3644 domain-containing protein [Chloroflexi bacterium]|nr:DUF3644 domain-containing protein [Chloroflexota bacterium]